MSASTNNHQRKARTRVMIVDPEWQFGLELADCLATSGYQAVLVRSLESMLGDLGELQPGAILLRADSRDSKLGGHEPRTLEAVRTLCPQASMLMLAKPDSDTLSAVSRDKVEQTPPVASSTRVEALLQAKLRIPCARML